MVVAVAIRDIAVTADIAGVFTSPKTRTRGRLILDLDKHEEFESDTVEIIINYQPNLLSGIRVHTGAFREVFDARNRDSNYIVLDEYTLGANLVPHQSGQPTIHDL